MIVATVEQKKKKKKTVHNEMSQVTRGNFEMIAQEKIIDSIAEEEKKMGKNGNEREREREREKRLLP